MKRILIILLAMMLGISLWGCGSEPVQQESTAPQQEQETQTVPVLYSVTVTDENGTPIPNAMVQLCSDICVAGVTNEAGVAQFTLLPAEYKASMTVVPQGYAYPGETTEFAFPEGSRELTIVLKAQ